MKVEAASVVGMVPSGKILAASAVGMVPSVKVEAASVVGMVPSGKILAASAVGMVPSGKILAASMKGVGQIHFPLLTFSAKTFIIGDGGFRAMAEDYYKLLGVDRKAGKDELKKVYRKLAMQYHPDHNKDDKAAEEKFKKINEAYAVLSNDEKRKQYDRFGADGFSRRYSQQDIFRDFDFEGTSREFGFNDLFGGMFSEFFSGQKKGRGRRSFSFDFGNPPGGQPGFGDKGRARSAPAQPAAEVDLHVGLEEVVLGVKKRITLDLGMGSETVDISIPKGIEEGQKLRLKEKGQPDPFTGRRGDLLCKIIIDAHPVFQRKGQDLVLEKEVRLTDLVLGGKVRITTLDNQTIELKIPPLTRQNALLRVKGRGIPAAKGTIAGNLLVKLVPILPSGLDEKQQRLFEELAGTGL